MAFGMNPGGIFYPGFEMRKELKEAWSFGLTRIEVSFYAPTIKSEKEYFDNDFIDLA
jgi:hypothetical protein